MIIEEEVLSVKHAAGFYSKIKKEIETESEIIIDLGRVERIDLSIIQIIIAAGREARALDKVLKLKSVSDDIKEQMSICGLRT